MTNLSVLVSGGGGLLRVIARAMDLSILPYNSLSVVSDRICPASDWAKENNFPTEILDFNGYKNRSEFNDDLFNTLESERPALIVSTFHRILSPEIVARFPNQIINCHPTMLPLFPGMKGLERTLRDKSKFLGFTVHYIDEGIDTGPILGQIVTPKTIGDTFADAARRIYRGGGLLLLQAMLDIGHTRAQRPQNGFDMFGSAYLSSIGIAHALIDLHEQLLE
jgi:phosphoribosylglycinamide formyltransferase-1